MSKTYTIKLTKDELENLKDALNYYSVHYYHKKIERAEDKGDNVSKGFWHDLWTKNLELFCKLVGIKEDK